MVTGWQFKSEGKEVKEEDADVWKRKMLKEDFDEAGFEKITLRGKDIEKRGY